MIINFVLSSSRPPRRGRSPPVRTEHRLAVENLSSRINWQVCNCISLFFVYFRVINVVYYSVYIYAFCLRTGWEMTVY